MSVVVNNLHVRLGSNDILKGVDFSIEAGERVAIIGPNGCGKSTLLRTVAGILKPQKGEVRLSGLPLRSYRRRHRARMLGLLNQVDVIPLMTTVRDHIAIGRHPYRSYFRHGSEEDTAAIERAIDQCQIGHLADRRVEVLSGGERQRVRLATLLAQSPSTLLLDEPLTGLDLEHQYALLHMLEDLNENEKRTIIVVLHDLSIAMRFFDRIIVLHDGLLIADGVPHEIMTSDLFKSVFRIHASVGRESQSDMPVVVCHRRNQTSKQNQFSGDDRDDLQYTGRIPAQPLTGARRNG